MFFKIVFNKNRSSWTRICKYYVRMFLFLQKRIYLKDSRYIQHTGKSFRNLGNLNQISIAISSSPIDLMTNLSEKCNCNQNSVCIDKIPKTFLRVRIYF